MLMSVDLPAPLGPKSPKIEPRSTVRSTPLSAFLRRLAGPGGVGLRQTLEFDSVRWQAGDAPALSVQGGERHAIYLWS